MEAVPARHELEHRGAKMLRESVRHGGLVVAWSTLLIGVATGEEPLRVQSRVFDIEYAVNEDALPLDSLRLWYTLDGGMTWSLFGTDDDRQSPVTFHAPREGFYGFFLVAVNATGPSSVAPSSGTRPYLEVYVDGTPPVVQLHPLRRTHLVGQDTLQIRWTAVDAHFPARPVELSYQRVPEETWHPVTDGPLANTGRYDWRLPPNLSGPVAIRMTAMDRGGHRVTSGRQVIEIAPVQPAPARVVPSSTGSTPDTRLFGGTTALPGSVRATERASYLFREAMAHRERGEYREGIARLREAVKLKPQWAEAFVQMAEMLYRLGDLDRALNAYDVARQQRPMMREALRGAAMVYRQQHKHDAAAEALRTILRYDPKDAEVWMNLGDIAVYQGDEVLARECYVRASRIDPGATQVIADARRRLDLMAGVSRRYAPSGN